MNQRQRKRKPRGSVIEPITAESLRNIFEAEVLGRDLKMPREADLKKLAAILEHWRQTYHGENILGERRKLQDDATTAVTKLSEIVHRLAELDTQNIVAAINDSAPAGIQRDLVVRLSASGHLREKVNDIAQSPTLLDSPMTYGATGWKFLIDVLPKDFFNAMKPANPTFALGISAAGPVARFIAAVVPKLTGEHPTVGSVATQLKARRRNPNIR